MSRGAVKVAPTTTEFTCPWCGRPEPSAWLLDTNHCVQLERENEDPEGKPFYYPRAKGMCMAQSLIRNHVLFTARALVNQSSAGTLYRQGRSKKFDVTAARAALVEVVEHAERHRVDHAAIIGALLLTQQCGPCTKGEHDGCFEDLTWSDLANDTVHCACWNREHVA